MTLIIWLPSFALATPINVILHEIGHAIPSLLFTKGDVHIDLGDSDKGKICDFRIGRLRFSFSWHNLLFHHGLTRHKLAPSFNALRLILLSGVIFNFASLFFCVRFLLPSINSQYSAVIISALFLNCAFLSIGSLIPRQVSINNAQFASDGLLFIRTFQAKHRFPIEFARLIEKREFQNTIKFLEKKLDIIPDDEITLRAAISISLRPQGYHILSHFREILKTKPHSAENLEFLFLSSIHLSDEAAARFYLNQWGAIDPDSPTFKSNSAFLAMENGQHTVAFAVFSELLKQRGETAYVLGNLAYIEYMLGNLNKSAELLARALQLNPNEAYVHRAMALIELVKENKESAKQAYTRAKGLNEGVYRIKALEG